MQYYLVKGLDGYMLTRAKNKSEAIEAATGKLKPPYVATQKTEEEFLKLMKEAN